MGPAYGENQQRPGEEEFEQLQSFGPSGEDRFGLIFEENKQNLFLVFL